MKSVVKSISTGLIFAGLSAFVVGCSNAKFENLSAKKLELKVGDKMPQFSKENIVGKSLWNDDFNSKYGFSEYYQQGSSRRILFYVSCKYS